MTKSDETFTCFVEVTADETAKFEVPLNTFSKYWNLTVLMLLPVDKMNALNGPLDCSKLIF